MKTRKPAAWILLLTLFCSLWGCRGKDGEKPNDPAGSEEDGVSAGVGTAEDCAGKIQSRASIWLAEHQ